MASAVAGKYPPQRGFGMAMGFHGNGLTLNYTWNPTLTWSFGVESRLYDIKAEDEIPVVTYNYSGYQAPSDPLHLIIIPVFLSGRYYPFEGKIANNFRPFVAAKSGPVFTLEAPDEDGFFKRWSHPESSISAGGHLAFGVDVGYINGIVFTVSAGIDILPMWNGSGQRANYNGLILDLSLNWRKR